MESNAPADSCQRPVGFLSNSGTARVAHGGVKTKTTWQPTWLASQAPPRRGGGGLSLLELINLLSQLASGVVHTPANLEVDRPSFSQDKQQTSSVFAPHH